MNTRRLAREQALMVLYSVVVGNREPQDALREALERGASDEEIKKQQNRLSFNSPDVSHARLVRGGDTLTGWVECAAKVPSKSKPQLGVIHEHWQVTNQKGELVMTSKGINMVRRRPA